MNGDQRLDEQETMEIGVKTGFKQGFQAGYEEGKASQKAVLDKIKAEIEDKISAYDDRNISEYKDCLEIIDKYKAESEEENADSN